MRRNRRGSGFHQEFGGSGEDSFVAVVVTKLTGALLFILLLTMAIMALIPKASEPSKNRDDDNKPKQSLVLHLPKAMPEAIDERPYHYDFSVRGESKSDLQWSIVGELPAGFTFDNRSGTVAGQAEVEKTSHFQLKIQVTDGFNVASGFTELTIWKPDKPLSQISSQSQQSSTPEKNLEHLLSQGFGFVIIWLGHFAGLGVIKQMEHDRKARLIQTDTIPARFQKYRVFLWILTVICTGLTSYMVMLY